MSWLSDALDGIREMLGGDTSANSGDGFNTTVDGKNAVVERDGGKTNIYFGGTGGDPLGTGHGHVVLDASGNPVYARESGQNGQRGQVVMDSRQRAELEKQEKQDQIDEYYAWLRKKPRRGGR